MTRSLLFVVLLVSALTCASSAVSVATYSNWSAFSDCSQACDTGIQSRTRSINAGAATGTCEPLTEIQTCNTTPCNAGWVASIPNRSCTAACSLDSQPCNEASTNSANTGTNFDIVNVLLGRPVTCASYAKRSFVHAPSFLNGVCYTIGPSTCGVQFQQGTRFCCCSTGSCPISNSVINCAVSEWAAWGTSSCSASCGGGVMVRRRTITVVPSNGGTACPVLFESQSCNTSPCPLDCSVDAWAPWGSCSATCGRGTYTRERTISGEAQFGGAACPSLVESGDCGAVNSCPLASACDSNDDCSSGVCTGSTCVAHFAGGICGDASDCTSGVCTGSTCVAHFAGGVCGDASDCTSQSCSSNTCLTNVLGGACKSNLDCVSGGCNFASWTCAKTVRRACVTKRSCSSNVCGTVAPRVCMPHGAGGVCAFNSDCNSGQCQGNTCL